MYKRQEEIGDKFGLTRERVRQIKEKAIRRLRQSNRSKLLKSYLREFRARGGVLHMDVQPGGIFLAFQFHGHAGVVGDGQPHGYFEIKARTAYLASGLLLEP